MKRCPTCNQTFEEDWLSFCTQDGTTLVEDGPAPTIATMPPMQAGPMATPAWDTPSAGSGGFGTPAFPQTPEPKWQPPPPPAMVQNHSLATAAMVLGIISLICAGPLFGLVSIILGWMALSEIKKSPETIGGRPQAMTGIITGSIALVVHGAIIVIYIFVVMLAAANH